MKTLPIHRILKTTVATLLTLVFAGELLQAAPTTTQTLVLQPGWNALHIEVLPSNPSLSTVFAALPIDSVWTYENARGTPEFVQEVSEESLTRAGWISWVPTNRVDSFQNTLFQLQVNRSYLVKHVGTNPTTLTLSGRPSLRSRPWQPDTLNFRGLPVDPALPPTFLTFFRPSPAHYSPATGLQPMYRMNASGVWQRVINTDLVRPGEAYWIHVRGGSDYIAPFTAAPERGDGLDFDVVFDELPLLMSNLGSSSVNARVRDLGSPAANPLSHAVDVPDQALSWSPLPSTWVRPLASTQNTRERLAVRRIDMASDLFETVLEITDGVGTRHLLPVSVARNTIEPLAGSSRSARPAGSAEAQSHAGLWVGTASLNAISEAHSGPLSTNFTRGFTLQLETNAVSRIVTTNLIPNSVVRSSVSLTPTPTASEFNLRLLLHVDVTGQTRLLKEVIEMWQNGTTTNDPDGTTVVAKPGRAVLVTDESRIGQFSGVSARDGVEVGRRVSTAAFDFPGTELPMSGDFAMGSTVIGTNRMSETFERNPFKHRYHPDHRKGFNIQRVIELEISPPPLNASPGYGERTLQGIYRETVTGLHRTNIVVRGTFRLNRVSQTATLNAQP